MTISQILDRHAALAWTEVFAALSHEPCAPGAPIDAIRARMAMLICDAERIREFGDSIKEQKHFPK